MEAPHPKVVATTLGTTIVMVAVAILNAVQSSPGLLGSLPTPVQTVILVVIPSVLVFLAGYQTPSAPNR